MPTVKKTTKRTKKTETQQPAGSSVTLRAGLEMAVYDQGGKEISKIGLPQEIFGLKINNSVVQQAVQAQLANTRQSVAHTKDRGEVRGGGKKPWRQKGSGRARHGSRRSPIWVGGGTTFGPRSEKNYGQKINKKLKRQALFMVLAGKLKDGQLLVLDDLKLQNPKTREMAAIVNNLKTKVITDLDRGALIILPQKNETVIRAAKNLSKFQTIGAANLNVVDLLNKKYLVLLKDSIETIKKTYSVK